MYTNLTFTPLKKYRNCNKCRASEGRNECSLGYACRDWQPLEPCPKPKTVINLVREHYRPDSEKTTNHGGGAL